MSCKKEHLEPKWDRDEFTCFGCEKVNKHVVYYPGNSYIYDRKTYDPSIHPLSELNLISLEKSKYKVLKEDKYLAYIVQICTNCSERTIWEIILNCKPCADLKVLHEFICNNMKSQKLIYPSVSSIEDIPNEDLDKNEKSWFNEAKNIVDKSPKAAGALLRAVLESLLRRLFPYEKKEQEEDKRTIGSILSNKGVEQKLGNEIIEYCKVVKIIGNDATHSGWIINKNENKKLIKPLFELINVIAKKLLTVPREEKEIFKKTKNAINQLNTKKTKNGKQQNIKSK